jgi:hypothetical protein
MTDPRASIPAGWYPDPRELGSAQKRWWDGNAWTEHVVTEQLLTEQLSAPDVPVRVGPTHPDLDSFPIRMRPFTVIRVNSFIAALLIAGAGIVGVWGGFAVGIAAHQGWILTALDVPLALFGLWMSPASPFLELVLTRDNAVAHGFLRLVRIPREAVKEITSYPSIIWVDSRGRSRRTPVNALSLYRSGQASPNARILARAQGQSDLLRHWATQTS